MVSLRQNSEPVIRVKNSSRPSVDMAAAYSKADVLRFAMILALSGSRSKWSPTRRATNRSAVFAPNRRSGRRRRHREIARPC